MNNSKRSYRCENIQDGENPSICGNREIFEEGTDKPFRDCSVCGGKETMKMILTQKQISRAVELQGYKAEDFVIEESL